MNILKVGFSKLRTIFSKPQDASNKTEKNNSLVNEINPLPPAHNDFYPQQLVAGSAQSIGKVRDHNEDALLSMSSSISMDENQLPFGIYIVADGMGGHQHGEIASGTAVRSAMDFLSVKLFPKIMGMQSEPQEESLQETLEACVAEVNRSVIRKAPGGGTTLTLAVLIGNHLTIAHVGDSRAYFIHPDGHFETLTQDHSLVNRLIEVGDITEEEAAVHPQRNVLYRAIGQMESFKPDISTHLFPADGYLLICSDGLWGVISQKEMIDIVLSSSNPSTACHKLVEAANAAGGPDNISVILVHFLK